MICHGEEYYSSMGYLYSDGHIKYKDKMYTYIRKFMYDIYKSSEYSKEIYPELRFGSHDEHEYISYDDVSKLCMRASIISGESHLKHAYHLLKGKINEVKKQVQEENHNIEDKFGEILKDNFNTILCSLTEFIKKNDELQLCLTDYEKQDISSKLLDTIVSVRK